MNEVCKLTDVIAAERRGATIKGFTLVSRLGSLDDLGTPRRGECRRKSRFVGESLEALL